MSYDLKDQIREVADFINESQAPIRGSEVRAGTTDRVPVVNDTSRPLKNALIVATAFVLVLILLGGVAWLSPLRDSAPPAEERSVETTIPDTAPPTTAVPATTIVTEAPTPVEGWNPILSETVESVPPAAAICPPGATPDSPGPIHQVRPGEGPWSNQAAVFDTHAGRIVFVDETAETWTFDVCTNTWGRMAPASIPGSREIGELVYDIDSDRTIAFGPNYVSVYDANINTWTQRISDPDIYPVIGWPRGAVYDPVSGLVLVVTDEDLLMAYDVDTNTWTEVGMIAEPREIRSEGQTQLVGPGFLVGYVADTDRLAFLRFSGERYYYESILLNPRTGESTPLKEPPGGVRGGFGSLTYATGGETAYPYGNGVCRLDPATLDWDCNPYVGPFGPSAMVFDAINDRIVVINNFCCTWPGTIVTDDVQAIDFNTGEQIELLATANIRTETDGS